MGINQNLDATSFVTEDDEFSVDARPATTVDASSIGITSGWQTEERSGGEYPDDFKYSETRTLVRFIDDAPVVNYKEHWINEITEGRRTFVCLGSNCPLCLDVVHKPVSKHKFNVINLGVKPFLHQVMTVSSVRFYETLQQHASGSFGPLSAGYWTLSRTGVKQNTSYQMIPVKARDLQEDFGVNEADVQAFAKTITPYSSERLISRSSLKDLQELANKLK